MVPIVSARQPSVEECNAAAKKLIADSARSSLGKQPDAEAQSEAAEVSPVINILADLHDPEELSHIYFAMEYHLSKLKGAPKASKGGRVEFLLYDSSSSNVRAIIEAKYEHPKQGIYQCATYMVMIAEDAKEKEEPLTQPLWGITSDSNGWIFLKLERNHIHVSKQYFMFSAENELSNNSPLIFGFLFELMGIPPTIDVTEVENRLNQSNVEFSDTMLKYFIGRFHEFFPEKFKQNE
jgi:hypothetical protein